MKNVTAFIPPNLVCQQYQNINFVVLINRYYYGHGTSRDWRGDLINYRIGTQATPTPGYLVDLEENLTIPQQMEYVTRFPNDHWWEYEGETDAKVRFNKRFSSVRG